ncbi:hypothetical protein MOQ72_37280 [Saccharopolyspora sp. K220]|uniref:hypothetical protein n=1 Tax=Saccharopolyspora soli TaxID=2926618 RepID=UPI001F58AB83|nr:hypothetical protein [Saccharopolyspora soli]MCI2423086.1 hypothetical protein [Saccharopolyspora soli]
MTVATDRAVLRAAVQRAPQVLPAALAAVLVEHFQKPLQAPVAKGETGVHEVYMTPARAVLALAGDVTPDTTPDRSPAEWLRLAAARLGQAAVDAERFSRSDSASTDPEILRLASAARAIEQGVANQSAAS